MTYNPRINNLDGNVVQVSGTLSTKLSRVKGNIVKVTGSTQLDVTNYAVLADASSNNLTITLPLASTAPGLNYKIKKIDVDKQPAYVYDPSTFKQKQILSGSFAIDAGDYFGYSVALNSLGNIALIGARNDETGSTPGMGLAYIFTSGSTGWKQEAVLSGSLATGSNDFFGTSVSLNKVGNIALIGCPEDETGSDGTPAGMGLSYVFRSSSTGWKEEAVLSGSLATGSADYFGNSVALNAVGNIALVGAYQDETGSDGTPNGMGLSYIFRSGSTGWQQEAILSGSFATGSGDLFGASVALNAAGNIALVGAYGDETGSNGTPDAMGLAYVFSSGTTGWKQETILSGSLATGSSDWFGYSVALNALGNIALVGAFNDETGSNGQPAGMGLSYIFRSSSTGWREETILSGSLATGSADNFGYSVALNAAGNIALVGAYGDETGSNGTPNAMGLAYIFRSSSTGWVEEKILSGSLATGSFDYFGFSVAINDIGNIVLVGAYGDETGSDGTPDLMGLAYVFGSDGTAVDSGIGLVKLQGSPIKNLYSYKEEKVLYGSLATGSGDYFGKSVALNSEGNIGIIGAIYDETIGLPEWWDNGLAYIFSSGSTGWKQEAILSGSLASASSDYFGHSVCINGAGNIVLVGAIYDETGSNQGYDSGLAYIFSSGSTGWKQEAILSGSLINGYDYFGWSVSLNKDGNIASVGAWADETGSDPNLDVGLVYIFRSGSTGWKEEAILSGNLAINYYDRFGYSVVLNATGNIILVGAIGDETGSNNTPDGMGLSYIFRSGSTGWKQEAILSGSLATGTLDYFGYAVALNSLGNIALVGAPNDETGSNDTPDAMGLSYIFRSGSTGWKQEAILSGSFATGSGDSFGTAVSLNSEGDIALVGAYYDETGSDGTPSMMGLAYIFVSGTNGWFQNSVLSGSFATSSGKWFGYSVALNSTGNIGLIGSLQDETGSNPNFDNGLAYVFNRTPVYEPIDNTSSVNITTQYEAVEVISNGSGSWKLF